MRSSFSTALAAAVLLLGCDHFLAKNNPCGGIYPADGVADVNNAQSTGTMEITTTHAETYSFTSDMAAPGIQDCYTFFGGLATADGSSTSSFQVTCASVTITFTVPDVRTLEQGAQVTMPASVTSSTGAACLMGTATLTIERAVGSKAAAPMFVTADFLRSGTIDFDSAREADGGELDAGVIDAGASSSYACPTRAALHGSLELAAHNYAQASASSENHCPALPGK